MTWRVVVASPHPGIRAALTAVLARAPDVELVAAVDTLAAAGTAVRRNGAVTVVVDAVLLRDGAARLGPLPPGTRYIIAGMDDDPHWAAQAVRAGASAYVVTDRAQDPLVDAITRGAEPEPPGLPGDRAQSRR